MRGMACLCLQTGPMRVMQGLRVATLLLAVVACDRVVLTPAELPGNFTEWLDGCREVFTQSAPPAGVVDPQAVVEDLRVKGFPPFAPPGARPAAPVFGVISNGPPNDCHGGGIVGVGEELPVWFVVWPDVPGANGGLAWALVDARSGAFLVGDGPPGG